ncbi:MAG: hypothetical protein J0L92_18725 [Deltaproteobacteria bacterium]|nr:hypothetical protein [Deltaproteobacteria bacterium]
MDGLGALLVGAIVLGGGVSVVALDARRGLDAGVCLVLLLTAGLSVSLLYWGLAALLNRTVVMLDSSEVRVQSGPLPWPSRAVSTAGARTAQAFGRRSSQGGDHPWWEVRILCANHRTTTLVGHLCEEEARYLADELSDALDMRRACEGRA